jgi:xanthine dehydrogenase accessory factor
MRFVGLVGSRKKAAQLFEGLRSEGVPAEELDRIRTPLGLDIGASTAEEIAVSILAELIAIRRGMTPPAPRPLEVKPHIG